ncbi:MAG TPA: threonine--tRNA ligase, partial [Planctomycetes bacterium]|nr:threonine--tRNA ligase [Planctomycetota bacterium]
RGAAARRELHLEDDPGGGVFYGPKIDFKMRDALGREWQGPTVQVDFNLPERFDLNFNDADNQLKRPVMVHRAIYGSFERFVGGLIEHFGGWFPIWLCPVPVAVLPITAEQEGVANVLAEELKAAGFRVAVPTEGPLRRRIRDCEVEKIPFMAVLGEREAESGAISLRVHGRDGQEVLSIPDFVARLCSLRDSRALEY